MTPDKRLNQIEPVLADFVQKVDRLIEGNGQIINEVSKISGIEQQVAKIPGIEQQVAKISGIEQQVAKIPGIEQQVAKISGIEQQVSKIPGIERSVAITAKGLAELTVTVNHFVVNINQRFDQFQQEISDVKSGQELILQILREKLP
ncbi:hypothetical protein EXU85_23165 [Spirosoma sp. KCTC 42546]|uniref:hypothetical protein n=1 Tax=Spirosoma sp. KCTC 42546 TaxID=2520506 RepID=UPI00115B747E|nr:hypothetical protein [Spirosoma sp. KCTC 42546]QDK81352.1 hypothetical protein EXU85_23165 [Spirosoma sp. KCTC 42546]